MCSAACAARKAPSSARSGLVRLKKAFSATADIAVKMMPSPKIGLSSAGKMRKKFGETIGIRPNPIEIATTRTLWPFAGEVDRR